MGRHKIKGIIAGAGIAVFATILLSAVMVKQVKDEYALKEASINARLAQISTESGEIEGRMRELLSQADKEYFEKQQLIDESLEQGQTIRELREAYDKKLKLINEFYKAEILKLQDEKAAIERSMTIGGMGSGEVYVDLNDIRVKCNASESQLNKLLTGTNLTGLGWEFLEAEHDYGVNAIVLMSIMKQESGLGRHTIAEFNSAGMKTGGGEWRKFESFAECIEELASLLSRQYLNKEGAFYNGTGITDVNIRYCLNLDGTIDWGWSDGIGTHVKGFVAKANE